MRFEHCEVGFQKQKAGNWEWYPTFRILCTVDVPRVLVFHSQCRQVLYNLCIIKQLTWKFRFKKGINTGL